MATAAAAHRQTLCRHPCRQHLGSSCRSGRPPFQARVGCCTESVLAAEVLLLRCCVLVNVDALRTSVTRASNCTLDPQPMLVCLPARPHPTPASNLSSTLILSPAGRGVFITGGCCPAGGILSLYPGLAHDSGDVEEQQAASALAEDACAPAPPPWTVDNHYLLALRCLGRSFLIDGQPFGLSAQLWRRAAAGMPDPPNDSWLPPPGAPWLPTAAVAGAAAGVPSEPVCSDDQQQAQQLGGGGSSAVEQALLHQAALGECLLWNGGRFSGWQPSCVADSSRCERHVYLPWPALPLFAEAEQHCPPQLDVSKETYMFVNLQLLPLLPPQATCSTTARAAPDSSWCRCPLPPCRPPWRASCPLCTPEDSTRACTGCRWCWRPGQCGQRGAGQLRCGWTMAWMHTTWATTFDPAFDPPCFATFHRTPFTVLRCWTARPGSVPAAHAGTQQPVWLLDTLPLHALLVPVATP